eukprot:scaffold24742_cov21-Tisochrysis_lutea.AAC.2
MLVTMLLFQFHLWCTRLSVTLKKQISVWSRYEPAKAAYGAAKAVCAHCHAWRASGGKQAMLNSSQGGVSH